MKKTPFQKTFWTANIIALLEQTALYGIYFGFGIYLWQLGFKTQHLGMIQGLFLLVSYGIPLVSGIVAEHYGFKKVLLLANAVYLPSVLILTFTRSFSGIILAMLCIGLAAGIFKPLMFWVVQGLVDRSNRKLGQGIYYAFVNIAVSLGPLVAGKLRVVSWNHAFYFSAVSGAIMFLLILFFYKETGKSVKKKTPKENFGYLKKALSDWQFTVTLLFMGLFFWLPLFVFFNLIALDVHLAIDSAKLYGIVKGVLGTGVAGFFSYTDSEGSRRILAETIMHIGYLMLIGQFTLAVLLKRIKTIPVFLSGIALWLAGFILLGVSHSFSPFWLFPGIFLIALGIVISFPRLRDYITWIAPKEKLVLYLGAHFIAAAFGGALSSIYTFVYGIFLHAGYPGRVWYVLSLHVVVGLITLPIFTKLVINYNKTASLSLFLGRIKHNLKEDVEIVPYDPQWTHMYHEEVAHLKECLSDELVVRFEHFGSTAIPGISAKPIIDVLVEVTSLDDTKRSIVPVLEAQGYEYFWRGAKIEDEPPFYAWFIKRDENGNRTHHIHMVEKHFEHWERIPFRDYLIEFPEYAREYEEVKKELIEKFHGDRLKYAEGKTEFIFRVTDQAIKYYNFKHAEPIKK